MLLRDVARGRAIGLTLASLVFVGVMATPAIAAPNFQITISPPSQTVAPGESRSFAVGIGPTEGFSDPVTLSVSSDGPGGALPAGVTGEFSVNPVTPPGTTILTLTAAASVPSGTSFAVIVTGTGGGITNTATGQAKIDFGLPPVCYGAVEGVVTDRDTGDPIEGANVNSVITDDTGHYRVEIPLAEGNLPIQAFVQATKEPTYWYVNEYPVEVRCGETTPLDFALVRVRPTQLSGRVVEGFIADGNFNDPIPTSTPIEGASVYIPYWSTSAGQQTTAADGTFDLGSFRVGYENVPIDLSLHADMFRGAPNRDGYWWNDIGFHAEAGVPIVREIALVKECTGSISGRVVLAGTNAPAADVPVSAGLTNIDGDRVTTDHDGMFSFPELLLNPNNAPATYHVIAEAGDYPYNFNVPLQQCGDHAEVDLTLRLNQFGSIGGLVLDEETGQPVEGAYVGFGSAFVTYCPCDYTDAEGRYLLEDVGLGTDVGPDGIQLSVTASKDDYWGPELPVVVTVHPDVQAAAGDILLLRRHYATITGVVRDSITHDPIPNANVSEISYPYSASDITDQNGHYTLERVQLGSRNAPRDVTVSVNADGHWPTQETVGVRADEPSTLDLELIPICEDATISGRVVRADTQAPIAGANVFGQGLNTLTDANGEYLLEHVRVGDNNSPIEVALTARAEGFHQQTKTVTVFCDASIEVNFGQPTSAIEGYVTDVTDGSPGTPMAGVLITSGAGGAVTDNDGYYKLDNVPLNAGGTPRSWDVGAEPAGFAAKTRTVTVQAGATARLDFEFSGVTPGSPALVVAKRTFGGSDSFAFTSTGLPSPADPSGNFTISTAQSNPDQATFTDLTAGNTYTVAEQSKAGWDLTDLSCSGATNSTVKYGTGSTFTHTSWQEGDDAIQVRTADAETVNCTFTNTTAPDQGYLKITKVFDPGSSGFTGDFTIAYNCGQGDQLVSIAGGGSTTVGPFDTGTSCTVSEPATPDAPDGWSFGSPVIAGSPATIATGDQAAAVEVNVTNSIIRDTGSLTITKMLTGYEGFAGTFGFTASCTNPTSTYTTSVAYPTPGLTTIGDIPTGSICTITETMPAPPAGYSFGAPTFSPSATVTIPATGGTVSVVANNTLTAGSGSLKLAKSLSGGPYGYKGPFQINYDCTGTAFDGSVSVYAGSYKTVGGLPPGTVCTISETLPAPPAGYSFGAPTFTPSATVTIPGAGATVRVTTNNTLARSSSLKLAKSLSGGPYGYKGPFQINYDCTGTAFDGSVSVYAGSYKTVGGLPSGTVCTISETLPAPPAGYSFGAPTFTPSATVTIPGAGATVRVTTNNTLARSSSLKLAKSLSGGPYGYKGPFQINYDCTGTAFDGSVSVYAGSYKTVGGLPSGTVCTISETLPAPPAGYSFGAPTFTPSATVTIPGAGATVRVTTCNTLTRTPLFGITARLSRAISVWAW